MKEICTNVCCLMLQTQADNQASKAKEAFYQKALQDLTLFKSKTNTALLQVLHQHTLTTPIYPFSTCSCP